MVMFDMDLRMQSDIQDLVSNTLILFQHRHVLMQILPNNWELLPLLLSMLYNEWLHREGKGMCAYPDSVRRASANRIKNK